MFRDQSSPVVQSPPEPASPISEPVKTRILELLEHVENPKDQIILNLTTLKLLEPVKSF